MTLFGPDFLYWITFTFSKLILFFPGEPFQLGCKIYSSTPTPSSSGAPRPLPPGHAHHHQRQQQQQQYENGGGGGGGGNGGGRYHDSRRSRQHYRQDEPQPPLQPPPPSSGGATNGGGGGGGYHTPMHQGRGGDRGGPGGPGGGGGDRHAVLTPPQSSRHLHPHQPPSLPLHDQPPPQHNIYQSPHLYMDSGVGGGGGGPAMSTESLDQPIIDPSEGGGGSRRHRRRRGGGKRRFGGRAMVPTLRIKNCCGCLSLSIAAKCIAAVYLIGSLCCLLKVKI